MPIESRSAETADIQSEINLHIATPDFLARNLLFTRNPKPIHPEKLRRNRMRGCLACRAIKFLSKNYSNAVQPALASCLRHLERPSSSGKQRWLRIGAMLTTFLGTSVILPQAAVASDQEKLVSVRGQPSIVEELNMGPTSTVFWEKLKTLILHPEIVGDFSNIVDLFQLTVPNPDRTLSPIDDDYSERRDALDRHYYDMKDIVYADILISSPSGSKNHVRRPTFQVYQSSICITLQEVQREIGEGTLSPIMEGPVSPSIRKDPTGIRVDWAYGEFIDQQKLYPVNLVFSPSGCLYEAQFSNLIH